MDTVATVDTEEKMKSLLEKLGKEKSKNEIRQENGIQNQPSGREAEKANAGGSVGPGTIQPAAPCGICGSCLVWFDIYGGGPHCGRCRHWPAESFIRSLMGYDAQDARWHVLWPIEASGPLEMPETPCAHRRRRKVATWPSAIIDERLVVDLERVAEVYEFWECRDCGLWILESEIEYRKFEI